MTFGFLLSYSAFPIVILCVLPMRKNQRNLGISLFLFSVLLLGYRLITTQSDPTDPSKNAKALVPFDQQILQNASEMIKKGKQTFRFDTFSDEAFWGDARRLHQAIATAGPRAALGLGLKVRLREYC